LVRVFKNDPDIFVQTQVAKALLNRAVIVGERVSPIAEKKVQDTLITHFVSKYGTNIPVGVDLQVAGAYINRGMLLENTKPDSAKADYATAYALLETYLKTNSLPQGKLDNLDEHLARIANLLTPPPAATELEIAAPAVNNSSTVEAATQPDKDFQTPSQESVTEPVLPTDLPSHDTTVSLPEPETSTVAADAAMQPESNVIAVAPTTNVEAQLEPETAEAENQSEPEVADVEPAADVEAQPELETVEAEAQPASDIVAVEPATDVEAQPEPEIAEAEAQPEPEVAAVEPAAEVESKAETRPEPEVAAAEPAIEVETQPKPEVNELALKSELTTTEATLAIQANGDTTNPTAIVLENAELSMIAPSEEVTEVIAPAGIALEAVITQPLPSIKPQNTVEPVAELVASNDAQVAPHSLESNLLVETQPIVSASEFIMTDTQPKDELTSRIFQALVHKRAILLTKAARPEVIEVDNALQANFADQLSPVQLADMWLFEASTYETQGDLDAALKVYDKIIGLQAA
jgi:hypothetical protein